MKLQLVTVLIAVLLFPKTTALFAQDNDKYVFDKKIPIAGDGGYDYLSIDAENNKLYISHGTSVNIVDLNSEQVAGEIPNLKGVHGIAIANDLGKGFISDGKGNTVVVFDLKTFKTIKTINIEGKDPDAITYDPYTHRVFTFNGDSKNSTVIDGKALKVIGNIDLGGGPEFAVSDKKGLIYNNLEDKSSLVVIDTKTLKIKNKYPLKPCGTPTGLAFDLKNNRLFAVCRENKGMSVVDKSSGKVITTLPIGDHADAVAYDAETKLVFSSNGDGTVNIFKQLSADDYKSVQTLNTQYRAKTMALDLKTHKIYLSVAEFEKGTKKVVPGTFNVLVYKMQ
jgi:DNA-binding beta-propeller fold protein YncE